MLKKLNAREERIIRMRFGFEDGNRGTLERSRPGVRGHA